MLLSVYFINYCVNSFCISCICCFSFKANWTPWTWQFAFDLMKIWERNETIWGNGFINALNLHYRYILKKHECAEKMLWIYRGKFLDLCSPLTLPVPVFSCLLLSLSCRHCLIVWTEHEEQSTFSTLLLYVFESLQFNSHRLPGATLFHQHGCSWQWFLPPQGSTLKKQLLALADMIVFLKSFLVR